MNLQSLYLLAFSFFAFVVLFYLLIRNSLRVMPYLYTNARLSARSNRFIKQARLKSISESKDLTAFCQSITDSDYSSNILQKNDLNDIHSGIEKTYIGTLIDLKQMGPKKIDPLYDSFLMFNEACIIKMIFKKKFLEKTISPDQIPIYGVFTQLRTEKIIKATIPDLKVIFSGKIYHELF